MEAAEALREREMTVCRFQCNREFRTVSWA